MKPLRPVLIGMAAVAIASTVAAQISPGHLILIWQSAGDEALSASDSDYQIFLLIAGLIVFAIYLVAGLVLLVTPARHLLVPNAAFWKQPDRVGEMRHRYATYLGRAVGATYWFMTAEIVVVLISINVAFVQAPWLPIVVSLAFVVGLLIFAVWVFADGFRPPRRPVSASGRSIAGRTEPNGRR